MKTSRYSQIAADKPNSYNLETNVKDYPGYSSITDKISVMYEEDGASEIALEPQNFNVKNQIEYVDFTLNDTTNKYWTYKGLNFVSLKHLLSVCIDTAIAGGVQLQSVRRNFDLKDIWGFTTTDDTENPVIVGRSLSLQAMSYTLSHSFPNIKLVSRKHNGYKIDPYEKGLQVINPPDDILVPLKNILIWIDPLDAEYEYKNNFLEYVTTMVCVAVEGKPIIGVIHQPFENFTKWGWVGKGISNYSYPVASEPSDASRPFAVVIDAAKKTFMKMKVRPVIGRHFHMIAANGAGYKSIQLTEGKADTYLHMHNIKKWKMCAGNALINALNGKMITTTRKIVDYGDPSDVTNSEGIIAALLKENIFFPQNFDVLDDSTNNRHA
ncbi:putative inositol monophosphatase 3 [Trichonephila clavipes]|uniref:inositol-phosphate phosphatase n=1 Tax=Trichonephila clavipes TaxID=2585209 RepID=A0A8X6V379_TRICX|nr:putative inositol monophosphatase 3 [Trichonephila clavipes]